MMNELNEGDPCPSCYGHGEWLVDVYGPDGDPGDGPEERYCDDCNATGRVGGQPLA